MRIFVTGATGFIGRHVLAYCRARAHQVTSLARKPPGDDGVRWLTGALDDDWRAELAQCDALLHLAAAGVVEHASATACAQANVNAPLALLRQAAEVGCLTWTLCGSCFEYGREGERRKAIPADCGLAPVGTYSISKAAFALLALDLAREAKARTRLMRPFQVFGEGEAPSRLWSSLKTTALSGADFPMTAGEQVRDFVPVEQVATALGDACAWADPAPRQEIWHVGTGRPQTLLEFSRFWWTHWGARGQLQPGALPYRAGEIMRYVPSVDSLWQSSSSDPGAASGSRWTP